MTINNAMSNATGLSDNITIRSQDSIRLSKRPVLDLSRQSGYLRTKVLDEFNGRQWSTSASLAARSHSFETLEADDPSIGTQLQQPFEIVFLNDLGDILPAPAGTRRIENANSRITGGWILRGAPKAHSVLIFGNVLGQLPKETEPSDDDVLIPDELQSGLGPIATELTASAKTNLAKASAIEAFFHQNFEYSLQTNLDGDAHPLLIMVQEHRPAYCVYFASAMTLMLRSQGVPARVASGYAPSEINRLTGRVIVRDRDAHAWVEAWSPEQSRYVAFDPTPTASRLEVLDHPEESSIAASIIAAVRSWMQRVYLAATKAPLQLLGSLIASHRFWLLAAIAVFLYVKRTWKRTRTNVSIESPQVDPALRQLYAQYVRFLKQAGITPRSWETDEEILARMVDSDASDFSDAARRFVMRYQASRFGGEEFDGILPILPNAPATKH
jgi:transglutaminase-like putative cysteine protease